MAHTCDSHDCAVRNKCTDTERGSVRRACVGVQMFSRGQSRVTEARGIHSEEARFSGQVLQTSFDFDETLPKRSFDSSGGIVIVHCFRRKHRVCNIVPRHAPVDPQDEQVLIVFTQPFP